MNFLFKMAQGYNDIIKCKPRNNFIIVKVNQKNTEQLSYLFCTKIHYLHDKAKGCFDHHLIIYNKDRLIFKVWLPNSEKDSEFNNVEQALESVGMVVQK